MNITLQEHIKQATFAVEQEGIILPIMLERFAELVIKHCLECGSRLAEHYTANYTPQEQLLLLAVIADYTTEIEKILLEP